MIPWPIEFARALRSAIRNHTGVIVSIGIGRNRFIAKVASKKCKPNGLLYVEPTATQTFTHRLRVEEVPGIGPVTADRLHRFGIRTLADAAQRSRHELLSSLGTLGLFISERAAGQNRPRSELSTADPISEARRLVDHHEAEHPRMHDLGRRSISRETTFREDIADIEHLRSVLGYLCERACWALRRENLSAGTVSVKVRFADFSTLTRDCSPALHEGEPNSTDIDHELFVAALTLLDEALTGRSRRRRRTPHRRERDAPEANIVLPRPVRLIGVRLSKLSTIAQRQWRFGEPVRLARDRRLLETADRIRDRYGFGSLAFGRSINLIEKTSRSAIAKGTKNLPSFQLTEPSIGR